MKLYLGETDTLYLILISLVSAISKSINHIAKVFFFIVTLLLF